VFLPGAQLAGAGPVFLAYRCQLPTTHPQARLVLLRIDERSVGTREGPDGLPAPWGSGRDAATPAHLAASGPDPRLAWHSNHVRAVRAEPLSQARRVHDCLRGVSKLAIRLRQPRAA